MFEQTNVPWRIPRPGSGWRFFYSISGKLTLNSDFLVILITLLLVTGLDSEDTFALNPELLTGADEYNYAVYLLADRNRNSVQVAGHQGPDRVFLIENNE